jgi:hypothetical protein
VVVILRVASLEVVSQLLFRVEVLAARVTTVVALRRGSNFERDTRDSLVGSSDGTPPRLLTGREPSSPV